MTRKRNSLNLPEELEEELTQSKPSPSAFPAVSGGTPFQFSIPTTIVELPSRGLFYDESHPLHGKESVEIKFMTANEEDILTSESLIKKNIVIDRLIGSLLIDKSINPGSLLVGDRGAIVLEARRTAYGSDYKVSFDCSECYSKIEQKFDLDFFLPKQIDYEEGEGFFVNENRKVVVQLPASKVTVELNFLNGDEERAFNDNLRKKAKTKLDTQRLVTNQLKGIIHSVEGVTDRHTISGFVMNMPAADSRFLRKFYDTIKPEIDMNHEYICENCGNIADLEVPLSREFFWPE